MAVWRGAWLLGLGNQQRVAKLDERVAADKRSRLADMVDALKTIKLGDDDGHDVLVTSGLNGLAVEADERLGIVFDGIWSAGDNRSWNL